MEINNQLLFCFTKESPLQVWSEIISPPKPATLTAPSKAGQLRSGPPTALAIGEDEVDELLVLLSSPRPFLHP